MDVEPPLTWYQGLASWEFSIWDVLVVLLATGYAIGLLRVRRQGQRWPVWRACSFFSGVLVLVIAVNSAVGVYSDVLFAMHMSQHLILIMAVPLLLTFGHPLSLWVTSAGTDERRHRRENFLRSGPVALVTHPLASFAVYTAVLVGTHLTPFLQARLENPALEHVEIALYLIGGYLLFLTVVGGEPVRPAWVPYPLRIVLLAAGMLPDTLVGVVLMMTPHPIAPAFALAHPDWGPTLLADQRLSGAIMWFFGDSVMAALAAMVIGVWLRASGSEAGLGNWLESARRDALSHTAESGTAGAAQLGRADAEVDSDEALAAYNAMLARLNGSSPPAPPRDE